MAQASASAARAASQACEFIVAPEPLTDRVITAILGRRDWRMIDLDAAAYMREYGAKAASERTFC